MVIHTGARGGSRRCLYGGGGVLFQTLCDTHRRTHVWRTEEFVAQHSPGRQLCSDVLIIHISSLLINDPSVPSCHHAVL